MFEPGINTKALPSEEQLAGSLINEAVRDLQTYVDQFAAALQLFDFCEASQGIPPSPSTAQLVQATTSWLFVAARDGAMTIYHFRIAFDGIEETSARHPNILKQVDRAQLKKANQMFRAYFPNLIDIRNSVAHAAEKTKTISKLDEHSVKGDYKSDAHDMKNIDFITVTNDLEGRRFINTWNGEVISYEISAQTLERLHQIKREIWAAFPQRNPD